MVCTAEDRCKKSCRESYPKSTDVDYAGESVIKRFVSIGFQYKSFRALTGETELEQNESETMPCSIAT